MRPSFERRAARPATRRIAAATLAVLGVAALAACEADGFEHGRYVGFSNDPASNNLAVPNAEDEAAAAAEAEAEARRLEAARAPLYRCELNARACTMLYRQRARVVASLGNEVASVGEVNAARRRFDEFDEALRGAIQVTDFDNCTAPSGLYSQPIGPLNDDDAELVFKVDPSGAVACRIRR
ncbi:MAG: hypothetical protein AAFU61_06115 [Pseudomonadota bacterium]